MRRVMMSGFAMAALAALTSSPALAGHTQAELHIFFGAAEPVSSETGGFGTPDPTTNPTVNLLSVGAKAALPIWMDILNGDVAGTTWGAIGFHVYGDATGFANNSGNGSNDPYSAQGAHQFIPAIAGDGHANAIFSTMSEFRGGYYANFDQTSPRLGNGRYLLGYMEVNANSTGDINLYISKDFTAGQNMASNLTGPASRVTIAFGAVSGGNDAIDRNNVAGDLTQSSPTDDLTQTADATIHVVVPEPATLGLLAMGVVGLIRRRRAA